MYLVQMSRSDRCRLSILLSKLSPHLAQCPFFPTDLNHLSGAPSPTCPRTVSMPKRYRSVATPAFAGKIVSSARSRISVSFTLEA